MEVDLSQQIHDRILMNIQGYDVYDL